VAEVFVGDGVHAGLSLVGVLVAVVDASWKTSPESTSSATTPAARDQTGDPLPCDCWLACQSGFA